MTGAMLAMTAGRWPGVVHPGGRAAGDLDICAPWTVWYNPYPNYNPNSNPNPNPALPLGICAS